MTGQPFGCCWPSSPAVKLIKKKKITTRSSRMLSSNWLAELRATTSTPNWIWQRYVTDIHSIQTVCNSKLFFFNHYFIFQFEIVVLAARNRCTSWVSRWSAFCDHWWWIYSGTASDTFRPLRDEEEEEEDDGADQEKESKEECNETGSFFAARPLVLFIRLDHQSNPQSSRYLNSWATLCTRF